MSEAELRENTSACFSTGTGGDLYYRKRPVCIPIIFNVEAVNSQNEGCASAARRGGVSPAIIPGKRMVRSCRAIPGSERRFSERPRRRRVRPEAEPGSTGLRRAPPGWAGAPAPRRRPAPPRRRPPRRPPPADAGGRRSAPRRKRRGSSGGAAAARGAP